MWDGKGGRKAHRVSWVIAHGKAVPDKMCVLHSCDNPPCVNPAHLFLGTNKDNTRDKLAKDRGGRKLNRDAVLRIHELIRAGKSQREIGATFSVSSSHVAYIGLGRAWKHLLPSGQARLPNSYRNRTHCKRGHELGGGNLYVNPRGERQCRKCIRMRKSFYRLEQRERRISKQ